MSYRTMPAVFAVTLACTACAGLPETRAVNGRMTVEPAPTADGLSVDRLTFFRDPSTMMVTRARSVRARLILDADAAPMVIRAGAFTLRRRPLVDVEALPPADLDDRTASAVHAHDSHTDGMPSRTLRPGESVWLTFPAVHTRIDTVEGGHSVPLTISIVRDDGTAFVVDDPARGRPVWRRAPDPLRFRLAYGLAVGQQDESVTMGGHYGAGLRLQSDAWSVETSLDLRFGSRGPADGDDPTPDYRTVVFAGGNLLGGYTFSGASGLGGRLGAGWHLTHQSEARLDLDGREGLTHGPMFEAAVVYAIGQSAPPVVEPGRVGEVAFFARFMPRLGLIGEGEADFGTGFDLVLGLEFAPRFAF